MQAFDVAVGLRAPGTDPGVRDTGRESRGELAPAPDPHRVVGRSVTCLTASFDGTTLYAGTNDGKVLKISLADPKRNATQVGARGDVAVTAVARRVADDARLALHLRQRGSIEGAPALARLLEAPRQLAPAPYASTHSASSSQKTSGMIVASPTTKIVYVDVAPNVATQSGAPSGCRIGSTTPSIGAPPQSEPATCGTTRR